jgi:selenocysteine lyase/cysteine desulfurase
VRLLGPDLHTDTLPVATFTVDGLSHGLVAARLSAEDGIGVRHGCFCAHPYMMRLLGLEEDEVTDFRNEMRQGDRTRMPGAVRASAGINTSETDVGRLISAVSRIAGGAKAPVTYIQDARSGDFNPYLNSMPWSGNTRLTEDRVSRAPVPS